MTNPGTSITHDDHQKQQARKKENNPFSEQEKHGPGEEAQRRAPGGQEYQGNPSVQRRAPGIEDDTGDPDRP